MNRKECYEYIKTHNLKEEATILARDIYGYSPKVNWTNLTTAQLDKFISQHIVDTVKKQEKKCCKKSNDKFADEGARKAILAIAKILNLKNIERNFN